MDKKQPVGVPETRFQHERCGTVKYSKAGIRALVPASKGILILTTNPFLKIEENNYETILTNIINHCFGLVTGSL